MKSACFDHSPKEVEERAKTDTTTAAAALVKWLVPRSERRLRVPQRVFALNYINWYSRCAIVEAFFVALAVYGCVLCSVMRNTCACGSYPHTQHTHTSTNTIRICERIFRFLFYFAFLHSAQLHTPNRWPTPWNSLYTILVSTLPFGRSTWKQNIRLLSKCAYVYGQRAWFHLQSYIETKGGSIVVTVSD